MVASQSDLINLGGLSANKKKIKVIDVRLIAI
jgi:hypothetical protein